MKNKIYYLYLIMDLLNNKVYVGQTVNPKKRWLQHKCYSRKNPIQYIHNAMKKYGIENFQFEVIASCKTLEDADATEMQLIEQYDSKNKEKGYNVSPGGDLAWNCGLPKELQPMYGKHHSKESIQKISSAQKGVARRPRTEEEKNKTSATLTGHKVSDETRKKMSLSRKGKPMWSDEQKLQMSITRRGRKHSEETKRKMSESKRKKLSQ